MKSLEIDSANAQAWFALAFSHGGASIKGATYSKSDCYAKSLEYDDTGMHVWRNLGLHGGGTVKGRLYSQKECFQKALGCNSTFAEGWNSLGYVGGGNVQGKDYSRTECYVKALESDSSPETCLAQPCEARWRRGPRTVLQCRRVRGEEQGVNRPCQTLLSVDFPGAPVPPERQGSPTTVSCASVCLRQKT